jgi:DNA-binding GntR family transcriptional regulator
MSRFQFTLIVEGPDLQSDAAGERLAHAGCEDALVGYTDGVQYLEFRREAPDPETAILSAIADAERVSGIEVIRLAGGGLVALSDIAATTGRIHGGIGQFTERVFASPN